MSLDLSLAQANRLVAAVAAQTVVLAGRLPEQDVIVHGC